MNNDELNKDLKIDLVWPPIEEPKRLSRRYMTLVLVALVTGLTYFYAVLWAALSWLGL